ncbi:4-hydroxy-2-oxoglutarate aldolase (plasmid) [Variovorax sp. SRS16]|uniref:RraA family protein n=1 Tax=Variovorax sp. SRS16 TaxID=282217 RepID=UPI001318CF0D|nr:RraA family protein [Variovorax sp. SRS16]VTU45725.1 4-hydroxy-2-oxoglutarate aldolase [Variovorax sp. SRS16]
MQAGFQVLKRRSAVASEWIHKFASIPVANISDSMSRLNAGGARLRPMHAGGVLCGPAVTVKTCPGDNLMTHMALNLAVAGDVIVVDAGGELTNAIVGERMLAYCIAKKFAGIVIHGAVRDYGWIRQHDFPVYACGVTHQGPYKNGPGEINTPISIGGMVVAPGDLMVGDEDGLLCIPQDSVPAVYPKAAAKFKHESETFAAIGKGDNDEAGYRAKLIKLGCFFEE